jgi:hypothetical protein
VTAASGPTAVISTVNRSESGTPQEPPQPQQPQPPAAQADVKAGDTKTAATSSDALTRQTSEGSVSADDTQSQGPGMKGRFVPTEEWLEAVKSELPLNTIMRLLQYLVPQVGHLGPGLWFFL